MQELNAEKMEDSLQVLMMSIIFFLIVYWSHGYDNLITIFFSKENTFIAFELMRNNIDTPHWIGLKGNATHLNSWDNGKRIEYRNKNRFNHILRTLYATKDIQALFLQ